MLETFPCRPLTAGLAADSSIAAAADTGPIYHPRALPTMMETNINPR